MSYNCKYSIKVCFGGTMKKHLHKFETTMWLFIKFVFYITLMFAFLHVMGKDSIQINRTTIDLRYPPVENAWYYGVNVCRRGFIVFVSIWEI